jgi:hypothetical protein
VTLTEELAAKAVDALVEFDQRRTFEEARAALREAGMYQARAALWTAVEDIAQAQTDVVQWTQMEKQARDGLDQATAQAEWDLDGRFVSEGNKTFLVEPCAACGGAGYQVEAGDGHVDCDACAATGKVRRQMTADDRRQWKQLEARKNAAVRDALALVADAERGVLETKHNLALAERAFSAKKHDLDAAIACVGILAASITKGPHQ